MHTIRKPKPILYFNKIIVINKYLQVQTNKQTRTQTLRIVASTWVPQKLHLYRGKCVLPRTRSPCGRIPLEPRPRRPLPRTWCSGAGALARDTACRSARAWPRRCVVARGCLPGTTVSEASAGAGRHTMPPVHQTGVYRGKVTTGREARAVIQDLTHLEQFFVPVHHAHSRLYFENALCGIVS